MKKIINRCPECGSTLTYLRIKLQEFACRKCGHVWPFADTATKSTEREELAHEKELKESPTGTRDIL